MTISEKVSYLKGLAEGMELDPESSKEAKLISVMIGVLEEVGLSLEDVEDELELLSNGVSCLEDVVYQDDDEDDDWDDDWDDDDFFEVACPECGAGIVIDPAVLDEGKVTCPQCSGSFSIDFSDEQDEK